ncbi:MAG: helix-turn-helix domain-containing protein [Treponema sp.]|nr:helix-turn-helix domain-containing protein [Treponema sp.]
MKDRKEVSFVIRLLAADLTTVGEAASGLGMSKANVRRLKRRFDLQGESAFDHGNAGRHPANAMDEGQRLRVIKLKKRPAYSKLTVRNFLAELSQNHGIRISESTLRNILKAEGLTPERKARGGPKDSGRAAETGELLCLFARRGDWLDNGGSYVLHGAVDDASGQVTGLCLCAAECFAGYARALRQTAEDFGLPSAVIARREGLLLDHSPLGTVVATMMGAAIPEADAFPEALLRIDQLLCRVEAALPGRLKLEQVKDLDLANKILPVLFAVYSRKVRPKSARSLFLPLQGRDLDTLLAFRQKVVADENGRFSFDGLAFRIETPVPAEGRAAEFFFSREVGLRAHFDHRDFDVSCIGSLENDRIVRPENVPEMLLRKYCLADLDTDLPVYGGNR